MFTSSRGVSSDGEDSKVLLFCVRKVQKSDNLEALSR